MISILPGLLGLLLSIPLCSCAYCIPPGADKEILELIREYSIKILQDPFPRHRGYQTTTEAAEPLLDTSEEQVNSKRTGRVYTPSDSSAIDLGGERANLKITF